MPGLDSQIIDQLNMDLAFGRIANDLTTDFVFAPHYSAIFEYARSTLWDQLITKLRSGTYEPSLPIIMEVPKATLITRPGAILNPYDRLAYQVIIDFIAPTGEAQLNRERAHSNCLLDPDPDCRMFEYGHLTYERLKESLRQHGEDPNYPFAIRADVAAYFERIYQHNIINLLHSSGCPSSAVSFLEKLLLAWSEKDSHGISQGIFPSDFLGNFALCGLDSEFEVNGIPSARYVDDLYLFFRSKDDAKKGLVKLCVALRKEGLNLNEYKTDILESNQLIHEETHVDVLFQQAREEVEQDAYNVDFYGFQSAWLTDERELDEEMVNLIAVENLYGQLEEYPHFADRIEKFTLPLLAAGHSEIGVTRSLEGVLVRPHMAKVYCSYLVRLGSNNPDIALEINRIFQNNLFPYEWQMQWIIATLLQFDNFETPSITKALQILNNNSYSPALRAICALYIGKHGNPGQRRNLVTLYSAEPSEYVKGAILFASRYLPAAERRTRLNAWGGHSEVNSLIANAVRTLTTDS